MFENILVLLDVESCTEDVIKYTFDFAESTKAKVHLVYTMDFAAGENKHITDPIAWSFTKSEAQAKLDRLAGAVISQAKSFTTTVLNQSIESLDQQIDLSHVDLIVTAKPSENISKPMYNLIKTTTIPILHIPISGNFGISHPTILVPLDGSQRAECTLPILQYLCKSPLNQIVLTHVVQPPAGIYSQGIENDGTDIAAQLIETGKNKAHHYLKDYASRLSAPTMTKVLVNSNIASSIHEVIEDEDIDLVVLSAHGESCESQWPLGSIAHNVISYATVPILVVQDLPNLIKLDATNQATAARRPNSGRKAV